MADTVRTISALLTALFQDGQPAGSITPQDMRDEIVSLSPPETTLTYNASLTWNLAINPVAQVTLPAGVTINVTGGEAGRTYRLAIIQGGTGSNPVTITGATVLGTPIYRTTVGLLNILHIDVVSSTLYALVV